MIDCSCNRISNMAFEEAVQNNLPAISRAKTLLDAVGIAYRDARDTYTESPVTPSCTSCFTAVAKYIQDEGLFKNEILPEVTRKAGCPRVAQCYPRGTSSAAYTEQPIMFVR